jgi:Co/Zn/Cd efflux system component
VNKADEKNKPDQPYLSNVTANIIMGVVTGVWVLNVVAGVAVKWTGYTPSDLIHGIFLAVVGGAFALKNQNKAQ